MGYWGITFYTYDGRITGFDIGWVQDSFEEMVEILYQVLLQTNVAKNKPIIFTPFCGCCRREYLTKGV